MITLDQCKAIADMACAADNLAAEISRKADEFSSAVAAELREHSRQLHDIAEAVVERYGYEGVYIKD